MSDSIRVSPEELKRARRFMNFLTALDEYTTECKSFYSAKKVNEGNRESHRLKRLKIVRLYNEVLTELKSKDK
jgi:hypothetical protein